MLRKTDLGETGCHSLGSKTRQGNKRNGVGAGVVSAGAMPASIACLASSSRLSELVQNGLKRSLTVSAEPSPRWTMQISGSPRALLMSLAG